MGIANIAQRVAINHTRIAGRLSLFTPNWRALTKYPWVINCIQGYTIDLVSQPIQQQAPKELDFSQEDANNLAAEVEKMLEKQVITPVPKEQSAKGFHSQLFSVPKKDGGTRPIINLRG